MEQTQEQFETIVRAALARHGITVDDGELAMIGAVEHVYGPERDALMAADLSAIVPERAADFGRAPAPIDDVAPGRASKR